MDILARLSCLTIYWFLWHFLQRLFQLILPFFWLSYTLSRNFPSIKLWEKSRRKPQRKVISFSTSLFLTPSLPLWLNLKILAYAVHARFTASPSSLAHTETPCGVVASLVAKRTRKENNESVCRCVCPCVCMCVCQLNCKIDGVAWMLFLFNQRRKIQHTAKEATSLIDSRQTLSINININLNMNMNIYLNCANQNVWQENYAQIYKRNKFDIRQHFRGRVWEVASWQLHDKRRRTRHMPQ